MPRSRTRAAVLAAATTAAAGAAAYGYATAERHWYRLLVARVPGALRGPTTRPLRILHITDVHLDPPQDARVEFLRELAGHDVDLVVATGDLLGAVGAEQAAVEALAPLTADGTPGLAVLGSNDRFGPTPKSPLAYFSRPQLRLHGQPLDTDRLVAGLADAGWRTLDDDHTTVETALGTVAAGGLADPHLSQTVLAPVDAVAPDCVADGDCDHVLHLGLVHAPYRRALNRLVDADGDLLLAGHTHGGQVRIPLVGALTANCDLPLDQARGLSRWSGAWLHVSAGLGTSRYAPFRFACRPEATILEVTGSRGVDPSGGAW